MSSPAAMIEGLLRHCTEADIDTNYVDTNYVDTHGAPVVGFAFTELLGFRLLPRVKNVDSIRLYRPDEHPTYAALKGFGRAVRTIFACDYGWRPR